MILLARIIPAVLNATKAPIFIEKKFIWKWCRTTEKLIWNDAEPQWCIWYEMDFWNGKLQFSSFRWADNREMANFSCLTLEWGIFFVWCRFWLWRPISVRLYRLMRTIVDTIGWDLQEEIHVVVHLVQNGVKMTVHFNISCSTNRGAGCINCITSTAIIRPKWNEFIL